MALTARYIGIKEVIECYTDQAEKSGSACFSMWDRTKMICQYNGDDVDEGIKILEDEIGRNIKRGYNNPLSLYIHPASEKLFTLKSPVYYNCIFKSYEESAPGSFPVQYGQPIASSHIDARISAMESRIAALMDPGIDDDDDDDDDDGDGLGKTIDGINTILAHPVVSALISKMISPTQPVQSLAGGVDSDQQILQLFKILQSKGVTINHIKKLAAMDAAQIQSLIKFL